MLAFLAPFIQPILNFFGGPVISGIVEAYKSKLSAENTTDKILADVAQKELELQIKETEVEAQYKTALIGHWYEPTQLLGYIMVIYIGKVIVWDKVLALGSTDAITGAVGDWAGMIIMFLVGKRGIENVTRILASRR